LLDEALTEGGSRLHPRTAAGRSRWGFSGPHVAGILEVDYRNVVCFGTDSQITSLVGADCHIDRETLNEEGNRAKVIVASNFFILGISAESHPRLEEGLVIARAAAARGSAGLPIGRSQCLAL
jgi:hypothetical protein